MAFMYNLLSQQKTFLRFQYVVKGTATKLGIDDYLRLFRNVASPSYRRDHIDTQHLRLLLAFILKEDANCIDVGAHSGVLLKEMVRIAPRGKHIAYEPIPSMYTYLVDHYPMVDVRCAALSNEVGERSFTYVKYLPTYSGFSERSYAKRSQVEKFIVRTETLDGSLPSGYVPDLIKIDVEGAERLVIEGAINAISQYKPIVVFEHSTGGAEYFNTQPRQVYELLNGTAGLRIFDLDGIGPYTLRQFEESFYRHHRWNYVACR